MAEENGADAAQGNGTEAAATKPKRAAPEVTKMKMNDGRDVEFVGKRLLNKDAKVVDGKLVATFDFRNGESRTLSLALDDPIIAELAGHGALQKVGDETAGVKNDDGSPDIDSMVLGVEDVISRLMNTAASIDDRWYKERAAGDGFSGASTVIRAIMEVTGKDIDFGKKFLADKLEKGKAGGLTRQKLYASFRAPGTKTAPVIERLEKERKQPAPALDANAELDSMMGG